MLLAMSGHPRAGQIIDALVSGTLNGTADGRVVIEAGDATKTYTEALTGTPVAGLAEDQLTRIGVNNRLRRVLRGLYARLTLMSPDAGIRGQSAAAAFTARDPESLPAIEEAIAKETVPSVQNALAQARAAIVLQDASAPELDRLAAIEVIKERGDQDAMSLLFGLRDTESPAIREAASDAAADIESDARPIGRALQNVYYGLSLGSVLLLAAIGLAVTFGVMGVINMAHGEMMMLGAYTTYVVQQIVISSAPGLMEWSLLFAVPSAFVVAAAAGVAIERGVIRFLYGRPLETLLATWGLSLIIQQGVRTIFGPTNKAVITPGWMSGSFDARPSPDHLLASLYHRLLAGGVLASHHVPAAHLFGHADARRHPEPPHGVGRGRAHQLGGRVHLRARLGRRGDRRRGAVADRQCQPQSRPDLHHRQLHGGGVRRRRESVGHAGRRHDARRRQQVPRALCGRCGRKDS